MISIPMLLTRRGWLGWATPYFLSLFVRLVSLHALRTTTILILLLDLPDPSSFFSRYFIQLFLSVLSFHRILQSRCRVPSYANVPQVSVCKIVLTNRSMVINLESLLTCFVFNREHCSKIGRSYKKKKKKMCKAHLYIAQSL